MEPWGWVGRSKAPGGQQRSARELPFGTFAMRIHLCRAAQIGTPRPGIGCRATSQIARSGRPSTAILDTRPRRNRTKTCRYMVVPISRKTLLLSPATVSSLIAAHHQWRQLPPSFTRRLRSLFCTETGHKPQSHGRHREAGAGRTGLPARFLAPLSYHDSRRLQRGSCHFWQYLSCWWAGSYDPMALPAGEAGDFTATPPVIG